MAPAMPAPIGAAIAPPTGPPKAVPRSPDPAVNAALPAPIAALLCQVPGVCSACPCRLSQAKNSSLSKSPSHSPSYSYSSSGSGKASSSYSAKGIAIDRSSCAATADTNPLRLVLFIVPSGAGADGQLALLQPYAGPHVWRGDCVA